MHSPVLFDLESQSRADLSTVGGRAYWRHPSTRPLCAAWFDTASGDVGIWRPGEVWPHRGRLLAAHNATGFDRFGAIALGWMTPADHYLDTSELARTAGLPGALDALGTRWLGLPKDKDASRFTSSLSSVRRPAGKGPEAIPADVWREMSDEDKRARGTLPAITPEVMARVEPYCLLDVQILAEGWSRLEPWVDLEPDVVRTDRAVNDRGVCLDTELCEALLVCDQINAEEVLESVARELGQTAAEVRANASSNAKFCAITGAPNAQKETVAGLSHPLARARRAIASIARGKLEAGLARVCPDGRLRDTHRYYGGHTGRWSGKGMQLQNLPRPHKRYEDWTDDEICALADRVRAAEHIATPDEINLLLRGVICAAPGKTLAVCDFSGVEARALVWAAGDHAAIESYEAGRSAYYEMAARIFGRPYESIKKGTPEYMLGKQLVLACGYGQGGPKFAGVCERNGIDLGALGLDANAAVQGWRKVNALSVQLWYACEGAFRRAIDGHASKVSCFDFAPSDDGRDVAVFLPSGRPIVYCEAQYDGDMGRGGKRGIIFNGGNTDDPNTKPLPFCQQCWLQTGKADKKSGLGTCKVHGPVEVVWRYRTYGGKIVENLIQALCRDLMARALVAAEDAGLTPVMHVHDEIVCEVDAAAGQDAFDVLRDWMCDLPDWAAGFPIGAAGFVGRRYRK